ncbi:MAG: DUF4810 domain-containing protein [Candidatus Cloacimonetes bacterium]|nr:DUF4810 domain-containing protein [Candidatus Cloacimonadota bacterium]
MKYCLGLMVVLFLISACTVAPPYLYYGNTSHSYYKAVKKQDQKSVSNYKASLEDVFAKSARLGISVPPGLYCDYAMLLLADDKLAEATVYFNKEKAAWSESTDFMDFLMQRYSVKD